MVGFQLPVFTFSAFFRGYSDCSFSPDPCSCFGERVRPGRIGLRPRGPMEPHESPHRLVNARFAGLSALNSCFYSCGFVSIRG